MPSKSLSKVQKHVVKKKGKNAPLHEDSRDSRRLRTASARDDKHRKAASIRENVRQPHVKRVEFFRDAAAEAQTASFSEGEFTTAIERYVHRHDSEIAQLDAERRPGRPASTRQDLLIKQQSRDVAEYLSGLWLPDLRDAKNVEALQTWPGNWDSLNSVKFCRVTKDGSFQPSSFPPKGLS